MKSIIFTIVLLFTSLISAQTDSVTTSAGQLTIKIIGIENDDGAIAIALSNSQENYDSRDEAFMGFTIPISNNIAKQIIEDLPFGEYAIKVYHDEDNDGELDTNFLGIPSEDYGFSNNATGSFGPASYEDAKFSFDQKTMEIVIDLD